MPYLMLSTGPVHYADQGQGVPLVLLHANPGDGQDFAAVAPALARHYRVLALDWPGYGQSPPPPHSEKVGVLFFYRVLREFLAVLALPPAFLVGNSLGGNAAVRLASEVPAAVRGLVLVAPGGFTPPSRLTRWFCRWQGSRWALSPYWFARLYLRRRTPATQAMWQRARTTQATAAAKTLNRALWRSFGRPENEVRELARRVQAPTLMLFGKHDPVISATWDGRVAAGSLPAAQVVVLPCGHAAFAELPEAFLAVVQPFLAGCVAHQPG